MRLCLAERDALDPSTAQAIATHLQTCAACGGAMAEQQLAVARLRNLPLREPPPGLEARLLALPTSAAAPMSLSPVLTERLVWLVLATATVLTAWGVWRAGLVDPDGRHPGAFPPVADERGRDVADARKGDPRRAQGLTGDELALAGGPTAVARLFPLDLRVPPRVAALGGEVGPDDAPGRPPNGAPQGRGPRSSGAGIAASAPEGDGGSGQAIPPPPMAGDPPASRPKPADRSTAHAPAMPTEAPTAAPAVPTAPTAPPCTTVAISVRIVADVAGGDDPACAGCDGRFDDRDRDLLAATMRSMPAMQVGYFSATRPDLAGETTILAGDARYTEAGDVTVTFDACVAPSEWPVVTQLVILPEGASEGWAACPSTGFEASLPGPEASTVQFALRQACPVVPPPAGVSGATSVSPDPAGPSEVGAGGGPEPPAGTSP